jgi:hypothetical protein
MNQRLNPSLETQDSSVKPAGTSKRRQWRRKPWENASTVVIGIGIFMLMQPFMLELYTYSFAVTLAGTLGFLITSHFPE